MAQYSRATLTDAGVVLARRMMDDDSLHLTFTGIATGDGHYSTGESLAAKTALKSQKQFFPLSAKKVTEEQVVQLKYIISNVNPDGTPLTVGYYVREVGVYAQIGNETAVLYAIAIADEDAADYLPEYDELQPSTITMDWFVTVANTQNISIAASPSAYALASDLSETNATVATKLTADGGDGSDVVISTFDEITTEYPVPAANDPLRVIGGKILKFCTDIVKTFTGASASAAGKKGLVPAPAAGRNTYYLRGDGTWQAPVNDNTTTVAGRVMDARQANPNISGTIAANVKSLNDSLTGLVKYQSYTFRYTVAANSNITIRGNDVGYSIPTGYAPLGIRQITTGSANGVLRAMIATAQVSGDLCTIRNVSSSEISNAQFSVTFLFIRTASIESV